LAHFYTVTNVKKTDTDTLSRFMVLNASWHVFDTQKKPGGNLVCISIQLTRWAGKLQPPSSRSATGMIMDSKHHETSLHSPCFFHLARARLRKPANVETSGPWRKGSENHPFVTKLKIQDMNSGSFGKVLGLLRTLTAGVIYIVLWSQVSNFNRSFWWSNCISYLSFSFLSHACCILSWVIWLKHTCVRTWCVMVTFRLLTQTFGLYAGFQSGGGGSLSNVRHRDELMSDLISSWESRLNMWMTLWIRLSSAECHCPKPTSQVFRAFRARHGRYEHVHMCIHVYTYQTE